MGKYWNYFKIGWQEALEYRFDFLMRILRDGLGFGVAIFLWLAIFSGTSDFFGYDLRKIITYYLLVSLVNIAIFSHIREQIAKDIRQGTVSSDLVKPVNYPFSRFSLSFSEKIFRSSAMLTVFLVIFIFVPQITVSVDLTTLLLFTGAVFEAMILHFLIYFLVGMTGFWMVYTSGFAWAVANLISFLNGSWVPLSIFPPIMNRVFSFLPFSGMVYLPIQIFLGDVPLSTSFFKLLLGAFWITVLLVFVKFVWRKGLKRYEAVGI